MNVEQIDHLLAQLESGDRKQIAQAMKCARAEFAEATATPVNLRGYLEYVRRALRSESKLAQLLRKK